MDQNNKIYMEEDIPLVSIIMPVYNSEKYIGRTLESVISQSFNDWEIIIVDDCSTDNSANIIKSYMNEDKRIKYYKLKINSGAAISRNTAIKNAIGKYIAFLDSDDIWHPEKLSKQIEIMEKNDYNFTCTDYNKIDDNDLDLNKTIKADLRADYNRILKSCPGNSTVVYNSHAIGKFYIPNIRKRNDYVMWLQVLKVEKYLYGINQTLTSHRLRENSISSNKKSLVKYHWNIYRNIEKLSIRKSIYLIVYWIIKSILK